MISSNDLRPGVTIEYKNDAWQVIESMHVKPGKGPAFVRTKLKHVRNGDVLNVTFRAGERLPSADVEKFSMIYLYKVGDRYSLINAEGTESFELDSKEFGPSLICLRKDRTILWL